MLFPLSALAADPTPDGSPLPARSSKEPSRLPTAGTTLNMSFTEGTRKVSASPPGEGAAEDKGGRNLLPELQLGRGEVRVRVKFRVMDWGRVGVRVRVMDRAELGERGEQGLIKSQGSEKLREARVGPFEAHLDLLTGGYGVRLLPSQHPSLWAVRQGHYLQMLSGTNKLF